MFETDNPEAFSATFDQFNHSVIAPLWTNFEFSPSGESAVYFRVTEDSSMLSDFVDMIGDINRDLGAFRPSYAIIITWIGVALPGDQNSTVSYF